MKPIRCFVMRGGTSRGVLVRADELSADREERDAQILRLLGSPDPAQVDGLGGGSAQTSKLAIIGPPTHAQADLDYTFAQVGISRPVVDMAGTCGNLSAAAALFAAEEGLVGDRSMSGGGSQLTVRMHNTNTGDLIVAHVVDDVTGGRFDPGLSRPVFLDYADVAAGGVGATFPTGQARQELVASDNRTFDVSLCNVGNPILFVHAADVGITGYESPAELDANHELIAVLEELRALGRERLAAAGVPGLASSQTRLPLVGVVSAPAPQSDAVDINLRIRAVDRTHQSIAGSAAVGLAAATLRSGSVPAAVSRRTVEHGTVAIQHPAGVMRVQVDLGDDARFTRLAFERSARRIMEGIAYA